MLGKVRSWPGYNYRIKYKLELRQLRELFISKEHDNYWNTEIHKDTHSSILEIHIF